MIIIEIDKKIRKFILRAFNSQNHSHSSYLTIKGNPYTLNQLQELKDIDLLEYQKLRNQAQKELTDLNLNVTNPEHMERFQDKIDFAFGDGDGVLTFSEQIRVKKGMVTKVPSLNNLPFIGGTGDEEII